ncbi:MAG: hypothetical protein WBZ27_08715, partial [Pseudolabrys sp.]
MSAWPLVFERRPEAFVTALMGAAAMAECWGALAFRSQLYRFPFLAAPQFGRRPWALSPGSSSDC